MTISEDSDKQGIRKIMREGMGSEFWNVMSQALDENIDVLDRSFLADMKTDFEGLQPVECKVRMMTYLAKKSYLEWLKELPLSIISEVSEQVDTKESDDVYSKAEDFIPKKDDV